MPGSAHFIRSVSAFGVAQILTWCASAVVVVLLPRHLGDANLGKLASAAALTSMTAVVGEFGIGTYLVKEIGRNPARAPSLAANALAMRIPLSLAAALLAVLIANLANYDDVTKQIVNVMCLGIALGPLGSVISASLHGLQQMKVLAALPVVRKVTYAGLAVLLIMAGAGPLELAIAALAAAALRLLVGWVALARQIPVAARLDPPTWREIFVGSVPFVIWSTALMVYGYVDQVMLSILTSDAVVGWYAAAYRLVSIPLFVPTIVMTVVYPALAAAASDTPTFNPLARRALQVVVLACVPMALGIMLLADRMIELFGYPEGFRNSVVPMMLLAAQLPLVGVGMIIGSVLQTGDRQRSWALTGVAAALLNPSLNMLAIPHAQATYGNGAIGAAATTLATEIFMLSMGLRLLPAGVLDRSMLVYAAKCMLAALGMGGVVFLSRDTPLPVPIVLGAVVYALSCLMLRVVLISDVKLLLDLFPGKQCSISKSS